MIPDRWNRLKTLFQDGAELPPTERAAFVSRIATDDEGLGEELGSLLEADDSSFIWLDRPLVERPEALLAGSAGEPAELGPYRLIRPIGQGGVSTVYLASRADDQFQQEVAVKLIQQGLHHHEIHRFHQERQILAGLNHPNIARLIDGGTMDGETGGRPYLVMEYIEGWHIDEYCRRQQLTLAARLKLFLEVAKAASYAHANLVVHRDIKPSNVLVTAQGVPKLLDFGIAKLLNRALSAAELDSTQPSLQRMTAGYASPEQVTGEPITTVSDVYSLGVLLYELLTGVRPYQFRNRSPQEIARVICEVDPPPPSQQEKSLRLPPDLDAIVLMALHKEPRRRYSSVDQLCADIERFLAHRPVAARRPGLGQRMVKLVRRNRLASTLMSLVVLFGLAMGVQTLRLAGALELARAEGQAAERERLRAQEVANFLVELFEVSDPSVGNGEDIRASVIIDRGARRVSRELAGEPRIQAELLDTIGRVYQNLGLYDRAEPMLEEALGLRRDLSRKTDRPEADIAMSLSHLAFLRFEQSDYTGAEALGRQALAMQREVFGEAHPAIASSLHDLGEVYHYQGRAAEAEALYREALSMRRDLLGPDHRDVAESLAELSLLIYQEGDAVVAESLAREALAIWRAELGPAHHKIAMGLDYVALALRAQKKYAAAAVLFQEALTMQSRLLGESHLDVAITLTDFGSLYFEAGDFDAARPLLERAVTILEGLYGETNPMVGTALNDLALVLAEQGEPENAEALFKRALVVYRATLGEQHPAVSKVIINLARLYENQNNPELAESHFREARVLDQRRMGQS